MSIDEEVKGSVTCSTLWGGGGVVLRVAHTHSYEATTKSEISPSLLVL